MNASGDQKIKELKKKADKLEKEAQKYEIQIDKNKNKMNLEVADHFDDLIINSIKAKLAILKN